LFNGTRWVFGDCWLGRRGAPGDVGVGFLPQTPVEEIECFFKELIRCSERGFVIAELKNIGS